MEHEFSFQKAINKEDVYTALFPPAELGLAIVDLYTKVQTGLFLNGKFGERDVLEALETAYAERRDGNYETFQKVYFLAEVAKLHPFFLRYDDSEQLYSLKEYAYTFCAQAAAVLKEAFSPTEIEHICLALREALVNCQTDDTISDWIDTPFDAFQPKMSRQVSYLEAQVDESVKQIKEAMYGISTDVVATLKDIGLRLGQIRDQSKELSAAFSEMRSIERLLNTKLAQTNNQELLDKGELARQFFPRIREGLQYVDKRLEKLQPRLRQLFSALSMQTFMAKTDTFLTYLLKQSEVVNEEGRKVVRLPNKIPLRKVYGAAPHFIIVERRTDFLPKPSQIVMSPPQSVEATTRAKQVLQAKINLQYQIEEWLTKIEERAKIGGTVLFSEVFFEIIADRGGNTDLAIRVGYALLRAAGNKQRIRVETTTNLVHNSNNTLALWEMKIETPL